MTAVLVPIGLDALVIRPGDVADPVAATAWGEPVRPASGATRQALAAAPFSDLADSRPPGVHLHWAVPDALSIRAADASQFPALPSRWLIVRLSGLADAATPRAVATWMYPNIHAPTSTVVVDGHTSVQPIGAASAPVSVRGRGANGVHPSWALGYDDTAGRLSFHDPLDDATVTGPLAYLVVGWYTQAGLDPLTPPAGTPATPTWLLQRLAELGWTAGLPIGAAPTSSIYHGSALAIGWPDAGWPGDGGGVQSSEIGGPPDPAAVELALADNLIAALAALLDGEVDAATAAASEAALSGSSSASTRPDGANVVDVARHQSRFRAVAPSAGIEDAIYEDLQVPPWLPVIPTVIRAAVDAADARAVDADLASLAAAWTEPSAAQARAAAVAAAGGSGTGNVTAVTYPTPRQWAPGDPVLVTAGLGRTLRHGADGRFRADGLVDCRVTGATVAGPTPVLPPWVAATDVPAEVADLLVELAAIDPGSVAGLAAAGTTSAEAKARASWWDTFASGVDGWRTPPAGTGWTGTLPSPIAVTRPSRPWNPLRLDWEAELRLTPTGPSHWRLGDVDFEPAEPFPIDAPTVAAPELVSGRGWLSAAPADLLAAAAVRAGDDPAAAAAADTVAASLEGFVDAVRGVPLGVWVSTRGVVDDPPQSWIEAETYPARPHVAAVWQLTRVRAVDTFGQYLTLYDTAAGIAPATPLTVPEELGLPGVPGIALRPRFTTSITLEARLLDREIGEAAEASGARPPISGFLVPNPFDGSVELVDDAGVSVAQARVDPTSHATVLAATPSTEAVTAEPELPSALALVVQSMLDADRAAPPGEADDGALAALVGLIEITGRAVDVTARAGNAQLSLLLGHPVCVVRLGLTLSVDDPQGADALAATLTPVRLGNIASLTDGVLAWFLEDAPGQVHPVHAAVTAASASPNAFVGDPLVWLQPNTTRTLVVLAVPSTDITVVSGLLPQKQLEIRREWTEQPLKLLTPTLGVDALVRDPNAVAMPVPGGINGAWTWYQRPVTGAAWRAEPVSSDPPTAQPGAVVVAQDGFLRVTLIEDPPYRGIPMRVEYADHAGHYSTIEAIGGTNPDGSVWRLPIDTAVQMAESGRYWFHVTAAVGGVERDIDIVVRRAGSGRKYLRTVADETTTNNLEQLPRIP